MRLTIRAFGRYLDLETGRHHDPQPDPDAGRIDALDATTERADTQPTGWTGIGFRAT